MREEVIRKKDIIRNGTIFFFVFFFECLKIGKKICKNVKPYWENSVKFLFLKKVIKYGFFCKCCVEFEDIRMRRKFTIA